MKLRRIVILGIAMALSACANQTTQESQRPEDKTKIAQINTKLAIAYLRDGDYELAASKLEKAIAADPSFAHAYSTYGMVYNRVGEFEKADENFRKALRIEPKDSAILNNYGQVLCQHGDHAKGQEMFLKANENPLYSTPEIALSNAGVCAMETNDLETAEKHFRAALQANPRVPAALLRMAMISYEQKRFLPARAYLQRYTEVGAQTAQSLWLGVRIERELGDKDALATYALKLEKGFPDSEETRLLLESKPN